jgi:hypothetical protein
MTLYHSHSSKLLELIIALLRDEYGEIGANKEQTEVIFITLLSLLSSIIETIRDKELSDKMRQEAIKTIMGYYEPDIRRQINELKDN